MSWTQFSLSVTGGLLFALIIIVIARRGILSMRYTFGWLFIAGCITLSGLFWGVLRWLAKKMDVDPFTIVVSVVATGLLAITVQLSITVSGLTEKVRTLAEMTAVLEQQIEEKDPAAQRRAT